MAVECGGDPRRYLLPSLPATSPLQKFSSAIVCHFPGFCPGSPPALFQNLLEVRLLSQPRELTPQKGSVEGESRSLRGIAGSRGMRAKERAAGPPGCGSHLQRTVGKPVRDGCGDSWRAWRRTHAILARQLSHALHCFPSSGSLACWPYPHPQVTSRTKSNLLVPSVGSELQYHDLGDRWLLWPKTARQREQG